MPKLASYLSGTAKKGELASAGDDADDTEGQKLPPPQPVATKKKDIVADPSTFKHVDENAKNVSYFFVVFYHAYAYVILLSRFNALA